MYFREIFQNERITDVGREQCRTYYYVYAVNIVPRDLQRLTRFHTVNLSLLLSFCQAAKRLAIEIGIM